MSLKTYLSYGHILMTPLHMKPYSLTDEILKKKDMKRKIMLHVPNVLSGLSFLRNTNLIATVPSSIKKKAEVDFRLKSFPTPLEIPQIDISMIWHNMQNHDPSHQWLREKIQKTSKKIWSA